MLVICGLDPSHVIGLYPNLLPEDFRKQLDYPDALPDLDGTELERGILSLIDYLTQVSLAFLFCHCFLANVCLLNCCIACIA